METKRIRLAAPKPTPYEVAQAKRLAEYLAALDALRAIDALMDRGFEERQYKRALLEIGEYTRGVHAPAVLQAELGGYRGETP
ncbi:MAG TPA: hypothetical protein VF041_23165 [Gemmatimonadaceae bacterium]